MAIHLRLDPLGGIAGDMFIAAMLDALPDRMDGTLASIRAAGVSADWQVSLSEFRDEVFRGKRFLVSEPQRGNHEHHHRYEDIVGRLNQSPLDAGVCKRATEIFELLAQAEADVHGVAIDDVTFHELGAWDSIADIVGAAYLIDTIAPVSWSVGPLPLGGGRVNTAHGPMPVPAPATVKLLHGFALVDDGIGGERITPTGAAILRYLERELGAPVPKASAPMTLRSSGMGFGTRNLRGISNVLRVLCFDLGAVSSMEEQVGIVHFEVDDQSPEDLALALDALRAEVGVLDVLQMPAVGKKGRMASHIQVLCARAVLDDVIRACFIQTSTIGLRYGTTMRMLLERDIESVQLEQQSVSVKFARRPDGTISAKAEAEDVRNIAGHEERRERRRIAEQRAVQQRASDKE